MKRHFSLPLILATAFSATLFAADKPSLSIGYVNGWDDSVATTYVSAAIIADKLGYPVRLQAVEPALMWQGLARGDLDLSLSAWLPVTHGEYYARLAERVEILGTNYRDAKIGLVVPDYVAARSIEDLQPARADFDGRITGIDAGAGVMRRAEDAIREYGLDYTLMPSSGPAMSVALGRAIDAREPIVVTSWIPHWMFAKWQLRFLDDPQRVFGEAEHIDTVAHPGLAQKAPEAAAFLRRFSWGPDDVGAVMLAISEGATPHQAARDWVANHQDRVAEWLD